MAYYMIHHNFQRRAPLNRPLNPPRRTMVLNWITNTHCHHLINWVTCSAHVQNLLLAYEESVLKVAAQFSWLMGDGTVVWCLVVNGEGVELNTKFSLFPPSVFLYLVLYLLGGRLLRWLVKILFKQLAYMMISVKCSCSYFRFRGAFLLWIARNDDELWQNYEWSPALHCCVLSSAPGFPHRRYLMPSQRIIRLSSPIVLHFRIYTTDVVLYTRWTWDTNREKIARENILLRWAVSKTEN